MGDVNEAWDVVLCRTVALKVLKDIQPAALIRFMHEAQVHARIVHPNICRIYDVDNYEGTLRVAMQLVHGPTLEQVCRDLSVQELVTIMALVAQAVHLVHRLNLIHRDLKPSNILLERNAEGQWTPFVCDFGLALALDDPALTYSHGVLGTPAYMAPEQFHGERSRITAATDVFALGGTLHYALTGRPPSAPFSLKNLAASNPPIPRDLGLIIGKCLEEDQEHRYLTASALAEDLWRYLQGAPIRASARNRMDRFSTWSRREFRVVRPYLLALGVAVLGGAGWLGHVSHLKELERRQTVLAQICLLEAEDTSAGFRLERTLPIHDLRPSLARIRARLETDRARVKALAPGWRGQGRYALGSDLFLTGDYAGALAELEQAWAAGFQNPKVAGLLALAALGAGRSAGEGVEFDTGRRPYAAGPPIRRAEAILLQAGGQDADLGQDLEALTACLRQDYQRAAAVSHARHLASPWRFKSAGLEAECLTTQARQQLEEGSLAQARALLQQAMTEARLALAVGHSDPDLHHAYFTAARALAALDLEWGSLSLPFLADLEAESTQALRLDPEDPRLQDDWVAFRWLKAMRLADLGQDPEPDLTAARDFLGTWAREPLAPALKADRMLVYWQLAEREFARRQDPGPDLTEALKTSGHTAFLFQDYFWGVLNFKARMEAARGADPRPTLEAAQEHLQPLLQQRPLWPLKEASAEGWLIRAGWESSRGLDPASSIRNALALAESARSQVPESASATALEGLAQVMEMKAHPGERARLLPLARDRLRRALALAPQGRNQSLLQHALGSLGGGSG
jgi:serine/threonine-protein kinase